MNQTDILEFLKTIVSLVFRVLFVFYVDKLANSFMVAIISCVILEIFWYQAAINKVLDKTDLDISNPNHFEDIAKQAIEEKNKMWPWMAVSWTIVPAMYEMTRFL